MWKRKKKDIAALVLLTLMLVGGDGLATEGAAMKGAVMLEEGFEQSEFFEGFLSDELEYRDTVREGNKLWLGGNRKFIFQHDLSYVFSEPEGIATNRTSLRFTWNRIFNDFLYAHVDVKPILYFDGDNQLEGQEDNVDSDLKTKELYVRASFSDSSITVGKKVVVWGESDSTAVTDVISPQNITDLVFTSVDESRLPQTMLLFDHYFGNNHLSAIVNPDVKTDEEPELVNDLQSMEEQTLVKVLKDDKPEYGLRWKMTKGRGDFSFMFANLIDNTSVERYMFNDDGTLSGGHKYYHRYNMLGVAANMNFGDVGIQIEAAYNSRRAQTLSLSKLETNGGKLNNLRQVGFVEADELLSSISLDYQQDGLRSWGVGLLNTYYLSDVEYFDLPEKSRNELSLSVDDKFYHELIEIGAQVQYELESESSILNISGKYKASDNLYFQVDSFILENINHGHFDQKSIITRVVFSF